MRMHSLFAAAILVVWNGVCVAGPATGPATAPAQSMAARPYLGSFEYTYPGFVLRVECHDDTHLAWTFAGGGGETVTVDRREIAPGIYLTTWTEMSGAMVAQVANYPAGTLNSVLIIRDKRQVLTGTIKRRGHESGITPG